MRRIVGRFERSAVVRLAIDVELGQPVAVTVSDGHMMPAPIVDAAFGLDHAQPTDVITQPPLADKKRLSFGLPFALGGAARQDRAGTARLDPGGDAEIRSAQIDGRGIRD